MSPLHSLPVLLLALAATLLVQTPNLLAQASPSAGRSYTMSVHLQGDTRHSIATSDGGQTWWLIGTSHADQTSLAQAGSVNPATAPRIHPVPNPTSGPTTVQYTLPSHGLVVLSKIDSYGAEVMRADHGMRPGGFNTMAVDATELSPGVYTYSIIHNGSLHAHGRLVVAR